MPRGVPMRRRVVLVSATAPADESVAVLLDAIVPRVKGTFAENDKVRRPSRQQLVSNCRQQKSSLRSVSAIQLD